MSTGVRTILSPFWKGTKTSQTPWKGPEDPQESSDHTENCYSVRFRWYFFLCRMKKRRVHRPSLIVTMLVIYIWICSSVFVKVHIPLGCVKQGLRDLRRWMDLLRRIVFSYTVIKIRLWKYTLERVEGFHLVRHGCIQHSKKRHKCIWMLLCPFWNVVWHLFCIGFLRYWKKLYEQTLRMDAALKQKELICSKWTPCGVTVNLILDKYGVSVWTKKREVEIERHVS